jgi:hypothetical protein
MPMATTIAEGDRVLIIDRKLYKEDNMRLFVGVVEGCDGQIIRVQGYPFHLNPYEISGSERHGELRTRIVSLISGDLIYLMARDLDVAKLHLRRSPKSLMLTDGDAMSLDLSEWLVRM